MATDEQLAEWRREDDDADAERQLRREKCQ